MFVVMAYGSILNPFFPTFLTPQEAIAKFPNFRIEGDKWFWDNDTGSSFQSKKERQSEAKGWEIGKGIRDAWYRNNGRGVIGVFDTEILVDLHYMAVAIMRATRQR